MNEMYSPIDRLEARIDQQAARIDALYTILEARGLLVQPVESEDAPIPRELQARPKRRARFRVGEATGV